MKTSVVHETLKINRKFAAKEKLFACKLFFGIQAAKGCPMQIREVIDTGNTKVMNKIIKIKKKLILIRSNEIKLNASKEIPCQDYKLYI